jgi:hypothetical protein
LCGMVSCKCRCFPDSNSSEFLSFTLCDLHTILALQLRSD